VIVPSRRIKVTDDTWVALPEVYYVEGDDEGLEAFERCLREGVTVSPEFIGCTYTRPRED
jgi:hypothetical protein